MRYLFCTYHKIPVKHELRNEHKMLPGNLPSLLLCMTSLLLYVETCVQVIRPGRAITGIGWDLTRQQRGGMTPLPLAVKDGKRCVTNRYLLYGWHWSVDRGLFWSAGYDSVFVLEGKFLCFLHVNKIYCFLVHLQLKLVKHCWYFRQGSQFTKAWRLLLWLCD